MTNISLRKWVCCLTAPSHFLMQCSMIIIWPSGIHFNQISYLSIQENAFENVICSSAGLNELTCAHTSIGKPSSDQYLSSTQWGRDKMATIWHTTFSNTFSSATIWHTTFSNTFSSATIWHTTFSNTFSSMKMFIFCLRFHWSLFLTIFQHWFRWWLGTNQVTIHHLNQWWLV